MPSINGISLDDTVRGWTYLEASEWTAATGMARPSLTVPGVDGSVPMTGTQDTPVLPISVGCTFDTLEALKSVFLQPSLDFTREGTPGSAAAQLNSLSEVRVTGGKNPQMELKAVLSFPGVWFRGPVETVTAPVTSPSTAVTAFAGISGKVTDSLVRLTDVTDPKVTDSAGTFVKYTGTVPAGQYLRIDSLTGRAWLTGSDTWSGGSEVDQTLLSFGRGPGFFTITPKFIDPETRTGSLTVTSTARGSGAAIDIKGRSAYLV